MERTQYLPFNPGNNMAYSLMDMAFNRRQIGRLTSFMNSRRDAGNLSEMEELELTQQIEGLRTQNARDVGLLAEGMENRLPRLMAGRPAAFARYTSDNLAAMRLYNGGSIIRAYGAINGSQARYQQNFIDSFNAPDVSPYSRTQGLNNGDLSQTNSLLARILSAIETRTGKGSFQRPGDGEGSLNGRLGTKLGGEWVEVDRTVRFN